MPYEALRQDKVNVLVASNSIRQEKPVHRFDRAFASGKCDLFVGNPVPNVRLVGVYLGTFRWHVFTTERYAASSLLSAGEVSKATAK